MERAFNLKATVASLKKLDRARRLLLGAIVAERLVPNYRRFEEATRRSNDAALRGYLDVAWENIGAVEINPVKVHALIAQCEHLMPSVDEQKSDKASMALDAVNAVCCLLEQIMTDSPEKVAEICAAAIDTIDMFLQRHDLVGVDVIDLEAERRILEHPLMQAELSRQRSDLDAVRSIEVIDEDFVQRTRQAARARGSNLENR